MSRAFGFSNASQEELFLKRSAHNEWKPWASRRGNVLAGKEPAKEYAMSRYGNWTRAETHRLLQHLGGAEVARLMFKNLGTPVGLEPPKYPDVTDGHVEAFINKIGGMEVLLRILADELGVSLNEVIRIFFDSNGRRIPHELVAAVCDANKQFTINPSSFTFDARSTLDKIQRHLAKGTAFITVEEFERRVQAILARICENAQVANLVKGPYFSFCIPQMEVPDYGTVLDDIFLAALGASYLEFFPKRTFNNYRHGELAEQVTIVAGSRHEQVPLAMAKGSVVGVYFPCLQGFSVDAQREQVKDLPEWLLLSGGFDTVAALIGSVGVMARDFHTPGLDMSALTWRSTECSIYAKADDDELNVVNLTNLGNANVFYSGGLSVLG